MGILSKSTLPRIFGLLTTSMSSLINRSLYTLRLTTSRSPLATFGTHKMLSFSKVWASCLFLPVSDVFPDICGRLRGEGIIKASLKGKSCGFCERLPVPTTPGTSTSHRGLQPIITEQYPWLGWKCSTQIGCLHSSVDVGLRVCTGKTASDSLVRCDVSIKHLSASAYTDIACAPFATNT